MSEEAKREKRLTLLDYAFDLIERTDFTLLLQLNNPPSFEQLSAGAKSAMKRFPVSGSVLRNRSWVYQPEPIFINNGTTLNSFVNDPLKLRAGVPLRQMFVSDESGDRLVTRFHHAAADGLSAAMWLGHQLSVACGLMESETTPAPFAGVALRQSKTSVRRSAFAYNGASDPLWTTHYVPSKTRRWLTISFPAQELQRGCRRARGFTYNDLLAACTLTVLSAWNRQHDDPKSQKIGLWYPLNIRRNPGTGFGNATSRVRVYARFLPGASIAEKGREVRKQVSWSIEHGEWVVPELWLFTRLPRPIVSPLLNGYLKQPTVDMGTAVFSHVDSWAGDTAAAFEQVTRIECVGPLHPRQHLAINGATHRGETWLTFTYDPALLDEQDARELTQMFEEQIAAARKELA